MTESEWPACTDPLKMLDFLRGKASFLRGKDSVRKLWLFVVACCRLRASGTRRPWGIALLTCECYADREASQQGLRKALFRLAAAAHLAGLMQSVRDHNLEATGWPADAWTQLWLWSMGGAYRAERAQGALFRDIFRNPFRPVSIRPSWRNPTVVALAQSAYDRRHLPAWTLEPARLAVLADALEEAGCDSADLLGHLRGPGPHVRGCWALDLLLGKE